MSSAHQYLQSQSSGGGNHPFRLVDIEHLYQLSGSLSLLYLNEEYSDITLVVEGQRLPAHKVILAVRSEYFRALFYGGMKESKQTEVVLNDAPLASFKALLKYVYSGHMSLSSMTEDVILDTLGLAHLYGFEELETPISKTLRQLLSLKNVCAILDTARLYGLEQLARVCHLFLDQNAIDVLKHETFVQLSYASLIDLLERDSFYAPEVEVFRGVCRWYQHPGNEDIDGRVMSCIRLPLMRIADLLSVVRPTGIVKADTLLDAIAERKNANISTLRHRGHLIMEENVATAQMGSLVISGELTEFLLNGDYLNYDMERGYTRHGIDYTGDQCIIVKLGMACIVNQIRLLLWDRDLRSYSYYIEVSIDQTDWIRVVDYSKYSCRSWQTLYFPSKVVQYIKVVGTHNTVNKVFHLVCLEASYKQKVPKLAGDIIVPEHNVATLDKSATVIEGVSRSRNALLNGDTKEYDWDSGYTCHQLGSGSILVQLGQPYMLSSLRLLLWDCDERAYSYYIESSTNICDWELLVDRTRENCRSWQVVKFTPRPVNFIRIVGTNNTANEVFHCVHFECPSADLEDQASITSTTSSSTSISAANTGAATNGSVADLPSVDVVNSMVQMPHIAVIAQASTSQGGDCARVQGQGGGPSGQGTSWGIVNNSNNRSPKIPLIPPCPAYPTGFASMTPPTPSVSGVNHSASTSSSSSLSLPSATGEQPQQLHSQPDIIDGAAAAAAAAGGDATDDDNDHLLVGERLLLHVQGTETATEAEELPVADGVGDSCSSASRRRDDD